MLYSSKSITAVKNSLKRLGVAVSDNEFDDICQELVDEYNLRNSSDLASDCLAVYMDAKIIDVKNDGKIRNSCIYVVIGINTDGLNRILSIEHKYGNESIDNWKKIIQKLLERGHRRTLFVVHDDFSGLSSRTSSLFRDADIQLCTVHLLRNAKMHLSKENYNNFISLLNLFDSQSLKRLLSLTGRNCAFPLTKNLPILPVFSERKKIIILTSSIIQRNFRKLSLPQT